MYKCACACVSELIRIAETGNTFAVEVLPPKSRPIRDTGPETIENQPSGEYMKPSFITDEFYCYTAWNRQGTW